MTSGQTDTDTKSELHTVEELEAKLELQPDDVDLKKELASALTYRYIYGEGEQAVGNEADIRRVREIVENLPEDKALYSRAYLAYLDGNAKEFTEKLLKFAHYEESATPFNSDELFVHFIAPFDFSPKLWLQLADVLGQVHSESASVLTLQGWTKLYEENDLESVIDDFVRALEKDEGYWLAAWGCAVAYYGESNWKAACNYYYRTLRSEVAQKIPGIYFELAWCLGKLKDYQGEEKYYRSCLELDPDYRYARNNLGWSLEKQKKLQGALEVFEETIRRGNDGRYPLRNKARVLVKLDRLPEAIETLKRDTHRDNLTKFAQDEITRLQELITKQKQAQAGPLQIEQAEVSNEDDEAIAEALGVFSIQPPGRQAAKQATKPKQKVGRATSSPFAKERWLESMIEDMIERELEVFGRRLRMYDHREKYGRQFAIPGVGLIDLLAEDIETNDLLVIELKRDRSDDQVIGQASRYITWVRENLAQRGQKVRGIVCAHKASASLRLSAKNIPELEVFEYNLTFQKVV